MDKVAQFEKVSFEQYKKDCFAVGREVSEEDLRKEWDAIKLPTRATSGSAGYDFYMPYLDVTEIDWAEPWEHIVCTGIRCSIAPGLVLMCMPKSGLGFKFGMRLMNTIGVIDSDYYGSDNEGHIMIKFTTEHNMTLNHGQKFVQGIFVPFGITNDDDADGVRNGGFGSTGV